MHIYFHVSVTVTHNDAKIFWNQKKKESLFYKYSSRTMLHDCGLECTRIIKFFKNEIWDVEISLSCVVTDWGIRTNVHVYIYNQGLAFARIIPTIPQSKFQHGRTRWPWYFLFAHAAPLPSSNRFENLVNKLIEVDPIFAVASKVLCSNLSLKYRHLFGWKSSAGSCKIQYSQKGKLPYMI